MATNSKLAGIFLKEHRGAAIMLEEKACYGDYGRPEASRLQNGIAVVAISGMLTESYGWYGSTYAEIRKQVAAAVADPNCKGILLKVNSPGGSTEKAFETADALAAAGKQKPIWAVCDPNCYSAAYLLASQARRLYVAPTSGGAGSIGVYAAHVEYSGMLEKEGVAVTLISAGRGKTDGNPYEPLSEAAKDKIQADVDRLYSEFVAAVATGRKMSPEKVQKLGADLYPEQQAIDAGLADSIGTYEEAFAAMAKAVNPSLSSASALAAANSQQKGALMDEDLKAGATAAAEEKEEEKAKRSKAKNKKAEGEDEEEDEEEEPAAKAYKASAKVVRMCGVAGVKAEGFINMLATGKPMESVLEAIINAKADASGAEISTANPAVEKMGEKSGEESPLLKAMAARGGQKGAK